MGLYVNHLKTVAINGERSLYVYLLDYGWPEGQWEKIFKRHFMKMADLASDTNAVVIASPRGVHFANEVLDWYKVGDLDANRVLPGLLITKTSPDYFKDFHFNSDKLGEKKQMADKLLVVPIKSFCTTEQDFVAGIEKLFADLRCGTSLSDFSIAQNDVRREAADPKWKRLQEAVELKPGAFGFRVDLKKLL